MNDEIYYDRRGRQVSFEDILKTRGVELPYLSKREYFAGLAMRGMLTSGCMQECGARGYAPDTIAKYAVMQADALIAELSKEEEQL